MGCVLGQRSSACSSGLSNACCQYCACWGNCPFYTQDLRCAARHGRAAAQKLTAEAERLVEAVSCASDIRSLLDSGEALEQALIQAMRSETALADRLCALTMGRSV